MYLGSKSRYVIENEGYSQIIFSMAKGNTYLQKISEDLKSNPSNILKKIKILETYLYKKGDEGVGSVSFQKSFPMARRRPCGKNLRCGCRFILMSFLNTLAFGPRSENKPVKASKFKCTNSDLAIQDFSCEKSFEFFKRELPG
jgi:hypothetical protein